MPNDSFKTNRPDDDIPTGSAAHGASVANSLGESVAASTLDDRVKYNIRFQVTGHRHDGLFLSLDEAQNFVAKYVVEHGLRVRDVLISDSFSNMRSWKSISKKTLKLTKPRLELSTAGAVFLSRYLEFVPKVADLGRVKIGHNGKVYVFDPAPDWPTRHRVLGTVDELLRDFVKRWNEGVTRGFSEPRSAKG